MPLGNTIIGFYYKEINENHVDLGKTTKKCLKPYIMNE